MEKIMSMTHLEEVLETQIDKNRINMNLRKNITTEFAKKGLNIEIPQMLFEDNIQVSQLNKYELMAITISMYEGLNNIRILNPSSYFSTNELDEYKLMVVAPETKIEEVIFENVIKINDTSYITTTTAKDTVDRVDNKLYGYNKALQRPPVEVKMGRSIVKKIAVNKENIDDLMNRFLSRDKEGNPVHDYVPLPTTISLAILDEGTPLDVKFIGNGNVGKLVIRPKFIGENPTKLFINDGFHRIQALVKAYKKYYKETGKELDVSLGVIINIAPAYKMKQLVVDSMKVTLPKDIELQNMTPNSNNRFIDMLINKSEVLKNRVADSVNKIKGTDYVTGRDLLNAVIPMCENLELKDDIGMAICSKKCANIIDLIYKRLETVYGSNFKKTYFYGGLSMTMYMAIANSLINRKDYKEDIIRILDELEKEEKDNNSILKNTSTKLSSNKKNVKELFDYFTTMANVICV